MEQPNATVHSHIPVHNPLPTEPLSLAALARQGSAVACEALGAACLKGPGEKRMAALRLLPGLVPFQPVWSILDQADRPSEPAAVRRTVAQVRLLIVDPRDCEPIYRSVQRALCGSFVLSEKDRVRRRKGQLRPALAPGFSVASYLRVALSVCQGLYDYRFEFADGCIGEVQTRHVEEFLLEYAPRRLLLTPRARPMTPEILVRHFSWLGRAGRLLPAAVEALCQCSLSLSRAYQRAAGKGTQPGSPRARLREAHRSGVKLADPQALHRHMTLRALDLHDEFAPLWEP
jgi:hypothetical protein